MPSILNYTPPTNKHLKVEPISHDKAARCFTRNYYLNSFNLTPEEHQFFKFCLLKAKNTNAIKITSKLIKEYQIITKHAYNHFGALPSNSIYLKGKERTTNQELKKKPN